VAEPVEWAPEGTPRSRRFGDVYRPAGGALEQARHVFLAGCGLPQAWAGQAQWAILENGFGLGLNFLATWQAWKQDPARPARLHFVSTEAFPVAAEDLVRSAQAASPALEPLARELASRWWGLVPGFHRFSFEHGHVLLTLCIGDAITQLRELAFQADAVFLDGFDPQRNPQMWSLPLLQEVARCCRPGTRLATWTVAGQVRRDLQHGGFSVEKVPGLPPKRECLRAVFGGAVAGQPLHRSPGRAVVVGAGLAGAACAASLARRGWEVEVLDAGAAPASGASALPAGLLAPHTSADDNVLSRLSRAGVRMTLQECERLLQPGEDWSHSGVLEVRAAKPIPDLGPEALPWQQVHADGLWHEAAAWVKPAALVRGWLATPGVSFRGHAKVARLESQGKRWSALDEGGAALARADLLVVAAALGSKPLLGGRVQLHAVRGQVSHGPAAQLTDAPSHPLNGNGHFLPGVPTSEGPLWLSGSTYVRDDVGLEPRVEEHQANLERLRSLRPELASALQPCFEAGQVQAWVGVRCASTDRRPLAGEVEPGLWVSTAMGSRGLTFAALCGELLAARLHQEPLPLPASLARALDVARQPTATRGRTAP